MGLGQRMNAKWNPKSGSESMDFLNEFLIALNEIACSRLINRLTFGMKSSTAKYLKGLYTNI